MGKSRLEQEAIDKLEAIILRQTVAQRSDIENDHSQADDIICEFLRDLGYDDIVDRFSKIDKWYA